MIFGLSRRGLREGRIWQVVTYMFLHGGPLHIIVNMLCLAVFGGEIEDALGTRRFLWLYFGCGILGGLGWLVLSGSGLSYCIGASGAVFGVLGTFAALFPERRITLLVFFVLPVTMTARTMAIGLGLVAVLSTIWDRGNIAHAAHLGGGVAGYLYGRRVARAVLGVGLPPLPPPHEWVRNWLSDRRAKARRRRFRAMSPPENGPPAREEVDRILEKITERGLDSLTREERKTLDRASGRG
jgi:membrane associated rhomboid family serine protease